MISASTVGRTQASSALSQSEKTAVGPRTSSFSDTMSAELGDGAQRLEAAEGLIGGRIRAPEGGCGCDALIDTTSTPQAGSASAVPTSQGVSAASPSATKATLSYPTIRSAVTPFDVAPGDVLLLEADGASEEIDLSGHLHQAIVRNATEMIAVNQDGIVEVLAVPWARVTGRR